MDQGLPPAQGRPPRDAGTLMTLRISRRARYVHIAVRDGCTDEPRLTRPTPEGALRGRGLMLIDNIAVHWGSLPSRDGKVVWATLAAGSEI